MYIFQNHVLRRTFIASSRLYAYLSVRTLTQKDNRIRVNMSDVGSSSTQIKAKNGFSFLNNDIKLSDYHPLSAVGDHHFGSSILKHQLDNCESSREVVKAAVESKLIFNANDVYYLLTRLTQLGNVKKGGHEWQQFTKKCFTGFNKCTSNQLFLFFELIVGIKSSELLQDVIPRIEELSSQLSTHESAVILCGLSSLQSPEFDPRITSYSILSNLNSLESVRQLDPGLMARTSNAVARLNMKAKEAKDFIHLTSQVAFELLKKDPADAFTPAHAVRLLWSWARLEVGVVGAVNLIGHLICHHSDNMEVSDMLVAQRCLKLSGFDDRRSFAKLNEALGDLVKGGLAPEVTSPFDQRRKKGFKSKTKRISMSDPLPLEMVHNEVKKNIRIGKEKTENSLFSSTTALGRAKLTAVASGAPPEIAQLMMEQAKLASKEHAERRQEKMSIKTELREARFRKYMQKFDATEKQYP